MAAVIDVFSNFSSIVWTEKHLIRFQSENAVFKFLWRAVHEALDIILVVLSVLAIKDCCSTKETLLVRVAV